MLTGRAVAALLVLATSAACGPTPEEDLEDALFATGLTLYLPDVPGAEPAATKVVEGRVETQYETDGLYAFTLAQQRVPEGDLCAALLAPAHQEGCETGDGLMRETFEEMSAVAVVRGETVLVVRNLVTEVEPGLLDEVARALRGAPEVDAVDLARP
ncbi:MAG: hypothetical protein ACXWDI_01585 [Nocardioides sp.]